MEKKITISNRLGLHARAASKLVQLTNKFVSEIKISKGHITANGKSILGLLSLAASINTEIIVEVNGSDENEALSEIEELFNNKFGESS
jgi:Phosphotransferase System HPr (HPr) Family